MSRARSLSRLANANALTVDANNKVGIGSTTPDAKLDVVGIVSATAFYGDGSNLDGVASAGLGTAVSETAPGDVIYYTNTVLGITTDITVDYPGSANISYTQYQEISVDEGIDFTIADGDEFIADVLGLSTEGITPLTGAGGRIRADLFTNKAGTGAPTFQTGVVITGVATATSFSGNLTGTATTATNLANAANITTGTIADARLPNPLPAISGANLTNLPAGGDSLDITASLFI